MIIRYELYDKSNQIAIAKLGLIVEEKKKYGISKYPVKIGTIDGTEVYYKCDYLKHYNNTTD